MFHKILPDKAKSTIDDNLPYAKIGSDLAPNNAVCELWNEERETKVYPLPVSDLLYVGPSTTDKFNRYSIKTIGDLANRSPEHVCLILRNKTGESLWTMATGQDKTPGMINTFMGKDGKAKDAFVILTTAANALMSPFHKQNIR